MCLNYHKGRNARYLFPLIAKVTTVEEYHQGLICEKESENSANSCEN